MTSQSIFLCVGSCPDNIVINEHPDCDSAVCCQCYTPSGEIIVITPKSISGCIIEIEKVCKDMIRIYDFCLPVGSLVIIHPEKSYVTELFLGDRYLRGYYNESIQKVMGAFGITDYCLPGKKR